MPYKRNPRPRRNLKKPKLGRAFTLSLRHSRFASIVAILITFPIFTTVILSILHPNTETLRDAPPAPPPSQNITTDSFSPPHTSHNRTILIIPDYLEHKSKLHNSSTNPEKTISLVAACMNRGESLHFSLPSWRSIPEITEIILVDWSSTPPLTIPPPHDGVSLIRVENAESWVLTRAYNLASKFATGEYILKVDCDTHLEEAFFLRHPPPPRGHYYTAARDTQAAHERGLRGVWFAHSRDFRGVGGYDERIVEYGYEDTDLYKRLDAFLQPLAMDLEAVRHHTAGAGAHSNTARSRKISTLMNEAFLRNTTSWGEALAGVKASTYELLYDHSTNTIHASITRVPEAVHESTPKETLHKVRASVLSETLHGHGLPLELVTNLGTHDQEFLAGYFDADSRNRVLVALLEGDALGNVFNLVSALVAAITSGRPVLMAWRGTQPVSMADIVDLDTSNERLKEVVQTATARRHGFNRASRILPVSMWPCDMDGETDAACNEFQEIEIRKHVYDERDPLPLSMQKHTVVRLNGTKVGGGETRALAYGCVMWSDLVQKALRAFREDVGVVAGGEDAAGRAVKEVRNGGRAGVVGAMSGLVRRTLGMKEALCEAGCGGHEAVVEVANGLAVVIAERVVPEVDKVDRETWEGTPVADMLVADLRSLHANVVRK